MNDNAKTLIGSPVTAEPKTTRERTPLAKVLPTDRIYFEKQVETLRAYAAEYAANGGNPVTNEKAGGIVGLSASTISQTNGFFNDIGIVTRAEQGGFIPGSEVIEYNNACQWDESEARAKLRPLFERTWFYRCLVPRLQLAPQSQTTCLGLLASESKAQKEHDERLLNLVKFLELAGIVSTSGGNVSLLQNKPAIQPPPVKPENGGEHVHASDNENKDEEGYHTYVLPLPKSRKITVKAPLDLTKSEIERLKKWAEFTLFLDWKSDEESK
jgi:hypothetical protein